MTLGAGGPRGISDGESDKRLENPGTHYSVLYCQEQWVHRVDDWVTIRRILTVLSSLTFQVESVGIHL